jgi:hypothetical protein
MYYSILIVFILKIKSVYFKNKFFVDYLVQYRLMLAYTVIPLCTQLCNFGYIEY